MKRFFYPLLLVFGLITVGSQPLYAASNLNSVTYGNNIFVAVGSDGTILTSPDGVTWTTRTTGADYYLFGVTYGNATFVAVGYNGTILTSPDGVTWTTRTSGTHYYLSGVTYGNSTFVAVGYNNEASSAILTSSNGVEWESASFKKGLLLSVTYGNSIFVAIGVVYKNAAEEIAKNIIITSKNGVKWRKSKPPKKLKQWLPEITYGNSIFVAVGESGTIITSPDGVTWTTRTTGTNYDLSGVTYGNATFVAVGGAWSDDRSASVILTSPDGVTWTER